MREREREMEGGGVMEGKKESPVTGPWKTWLAVKCCRGV